ncbi:MAG: DUF4292 domain-containing protein [Dysgonamonadaceae bacterium]|jgi:hypothetical protein|nr:DUF4292 domain-containing protein [Dysgonamonadaceae bacterium]
MNRKNKIISLPVFFAIALTVCSCKTSRQTAQIALMKADKTERIESIQFSAVSYRTLSSSLRFSIKPGHNKKSTTVDAQLKIIKDKMIQLSLRIPILGTEAGRISISPEKVMIIDRINKCYFLDTMDNLRKEAPFEFDYYSLQALLSNQLFIAGKNEFNSEDYNSFSLKEDSFLVILQNTDKQGIHYEFTSDYKNRILKTELYKNKNEAGLNCNYQDFGLTSNKKLFPMKITMEAVLSADLIRTDWSFSNVILDTDIALDDAIPQKYNRIDLNQIIKFIQAE